VHQSCIVNRPGYKGLQDDEPVEFDLTKEESGRLRANKVTAPGGGPVTGFPDQTMGATNLTTALGMLAGVNANSALGAAMNAGTTGAATRVSQPPTTGSLPEGRLRGVCKWFNPAKGYGFITPSDGTEDVFVHHSNIISKQTPRSLMEGENVEFSLMPPDTANPSAKRKANNVTGPGGAHVIGQGQQPAVGATPTSAGATTVYPSAPSTVTPASAAAGAATSSTGGDPFTTYYNQLQQYVHQYPQYAQYAQQQYQQFVSSYYAAASASGVALVPPSTTTTTSAPSTTPTNGYSTAYPPSAYPASATAYTGYPAYQGGYPSADPSTQSYPGQ